MIRDWYNQNENSDLEIKTVNNLIYIDTFYTEEILLTTEAYKGHCVLCKDVLSFVFQTFDFQVLCFGFCVLCPVLLNGAMAT